MTVEELRKVLRGLPKTAEVKIGWDDNSSGVWYSPITSHHYEKFKGKLYLFNDEKDVKDSEDKEL